MPPSLIHDVEVARDDGRVLVIRHNRLVSGALLILSGGGLIVAGLYRHWILVLLLILPVYAFAIDALRRRELLIDREAKTITVRAQTLGKTAPSRRFPLEELSGFEVREVVFHGTRPSSTWSVDMRLAGRQPPIEVGRFATQRAAFRFADELNARLGRPSAAKA